MKKLQVGSIICASVAKKYNIRIPSKGRPVFTYVSIPKDSLGFADASLYLPEDYILCTLNLEDGRRHHGWWTGHNWDGYKMKARDKVISWRRSEEA